jgi:hypothetical protein
MSIPIRPRGIEPDIETKGTSPGDRIGDSKRAQGSIPDDPHEQRRVRNRLIALAVAVPIAQLLRVLFR